MALTGSLSHTLANLISLVSLENLGEGDEFRSGKVLVNFQNLNPKQKHNAGRLCAVSRTSRTSGVSRTGGSEDKDKDAAKGDSKAQVEVAERIIEQVRRSRRTKAQIEAYSELQTIEDFFRELDAIAEGDEVDNLEVESSPETPNLPHVESPGIATDNGVVRPKDKRKSRSKRVVKADQILSELIPSLSFIPEDSEIVGAEISSDKDSDLVDNVAREQHEDGKDEKKTESNSIGTQKSSTRKKRPGRRERGVLSQEVAEASKHDITAEVSEGRSETGFANGSPHNHKLSTVGNNNSTETCSDGSRENSAVESPKNGIHVEHSSEVSHTMRDSSISPPLDSSTPSKDVTNVRETTVLNYGSVEYFFPISIRAELHNDTAGSGAVSVSNAEHIPSEELGLPLRRSGAKRRRQRRKRASVDRESGEGDRGQEGPVNLHEVLPLQEDDFEPIDWCNVQFKVQAELEPNQRLCVVGANPELGGWDLSLALPLLKSQDEDSQNMWENTIKVPQGMMLEYKYFVEAGGADQFSVDRRFGPEIQYFIPQVESQGPSLEVIRESWLPEHPVKLHSLSWGSRWWEQIESSDPLNEVDSESSSDISDRKVELPSEILQAESFLKTEVLDEGAQQVGAGQVVASDEEKVSGSEKVKGADEWLKRKIRKKALPREEPWLIESMIMGQRSDSQKKKAEEKEEATIDGLEAAVEVEQKKDLPPVQVEILINSPQCTMQRMAILEDGKLVELLLEPVNTRVQVGNVYLGVVKQLLPGMSGVFVDIGGFQLALLDITRNQYPYTFPNLCHPNGAMSNGSAPITFDYDGTCEDDVSEDEDEDFSDIGEYTVDGDEEVQGKYFEEEELSAESGDDVDSENDNITEDVSLKGGVKGLSNHPVIRSDANSPGPITVNFGRKLKKWRKLEEGMQIIVQVKKEALGKKGPRLTAFPSLAGRFWVLGTRGRTVGVSRRITGPERRRLRGLAMELQPPNFGLTVRTEALGHNREELERDLARLLETWKEILDLAASSAVAGEHETEGAVPVLLHRAMGQTLTIVRDFFNTKVHRMVIDSPQCFQEVTSYLQEVAPNLCDRVELYIGAQPIFDAYNLEAEIDKFSNKRVNLPNGGYLILEETEALVSIDVNGGTGMLAQDISQGEAILEVNLAAARQIAVEIRLRDIGGIIVVDFIDMDDPSHHRLVYEEIRKAIQRDRSTLNLSEISEFGLMEMTRKRVRPSVTLTISEACPLCHGVGRVEAHETTLSRIERAVRRVLATKPRQADLSDSSKWPQFLLRVDPVMGEYLRARKRKRITQLSAALKAWLTLKVALEFSSSYFQVLEQTRGPQEKRGNGTGQQRANQHNSGAVPTGGLLSKRVWPGKRRRNFGNQ